MLEKAIKIQTLQPAGEAPLPSATPADFLNFSEGVFHASPVGFVTNLLNQRKKQLSDDLMEKKTARALFELAEIYFAKGKFTHAKKLYSQAIAEDEDFLIAYRQAIKCSLILGNLSHADKLFGLLVEQMHRRSDVVHEYALLKLFIATQSPKEVEAADSLIDEVLEKEPRNENALNTKGFLLLNFKNDIDGAAAEFKEALKINEKSKFALNNLGVCFLMKKDYESAETFLEKSNSVDLSYKDPYVNLLNVFVSQKSHSKALRVLEKAEKNKIELDEKQRVLAGWLMIQLGKFQEAAARYFEQLKTDKKNPLLLNNLGYCLAKLGKYSDAEELLQRAEKIVEEKAARPVRVDLMLPFYNLGRIAIEKGDTKKLEKIVNKIFELNPKDLFVYFLRGTLYLLKGDHKDAQADLERSVQLTPGVAEIYPNLTFIYSSINGDYEKAVELLEKARSAGVNSTLIDNNLAHALISLGKIDDAEKILHGYNNDSPKEILGTIALLHFRKGNLRVAEKLFKKASELYGGDARASILLQILAFEKAKLFFGERDYVSASKNIQAGLKLPESYVSDDLLGLESELKKMI